MSLITTYLENASAEQKAAVKRLLAIARQVEPDLQEAFNYGVPGLQYKGRSLLGFAVLKNSISFYPFSPPAIEAVKEKLEGFDVSKGTVRFTLDKPIPDDVLRDILRQRHQEIMAKIHN